MAKLPRFLDANKTPLSINSDRNPWSSASCGSTAPLRPPHPAFRLPPPHPLNCFECPRRAPQSAETPLIAGKRRPATERAAWPEPNTAARRGAGPHSAAVSRRAPVHTSSRRGCTTDHRARGRPSLRAGSPNLRGGPARRAPAGSTPSETRVSCPAAVDGLVRGDSFRPGRCCTPRAREREREWPRHPDRPLDRNARIRAGRRRLANARA